MTGYNKVNGEYAGGNAYLVNELLKGIWDYKGWVMSDWGATSEWDFALKGLDQESGAQLDQMLSHVEPFTEPLRRAYAERKLSKERLADMVRRILHAAFAVGIDTWGPAPAVDMAAHHDVALEIARQGIVLLKNHGLLPLPTNKPLKIAVIGGYAQLGVPTGTGSSAVRPVGGHAAVVPIGGAGVMGITRNLYLLPSSPIAELKKLLPQAQIDFDPGQTPAEAVLLAKRSDVAIVFGVRAEGEGFDLADFSLPWGQDAVIDQVAMANPKTIVVLETGNPVAMPWRGKVEAVVQAWYPGQAGGQAIAEVLTGVVNPSGHLPITFPIDRTQLPRPEVPGLGTPHGTPTTIRYDEGAEVGYRWYAQKHYTPLYPFGYGLSYTTFVYEDLTVNGGDTIRSTFVVTNVGPMIGADVPQVYLTDAAGEHRLRLLGFERVELAPGASQTVTVTADPRVLARFDAALGRWRMAGGTYRIAVGRSAGDLVLTGSASMTARAFGE